MSCRQAVRSSLGNDGLYLILMYLIAHVRYFPGNDGRTVDISEVINLFSTHGHAMLLSQGWYKPVELHVYFSISPAPPCEGPTLSKRKSD